MLVVIYGLINSCILAFVSLGFALVYSIARVPNFAHGALYVFAGYLSWVLLNELNVPFIVSIIVAILFTAILGWVIYRCVIIKIRGMPISEVIVTYAIGVAILETLRWKGLRGATFMLPPLLHGSFNLYETVVDYQRILIVLFTIGMFSFLYIFTHYTKIGLSFRAIAQDERAALMLGIDSDKAASIALCMGSAIAGLSAVLILPLGNIVVEAGYFVLILSLAVCVLGGLGSTVGILVASLIVGFSQIVVEKFIAPHFQMVVALLAILLILIFKPSGIFGVQKELEERV